MSVSRWLRCRSTDTWLFRRRAESAPSGAGFDVVACKPSVVFKEAETIALVFRRLCVDMSTRLRAGGRQQVRSPRCWRQQLPSIRLRCRARRPLSCDADGRRTPGAGRAIWKLPRRQSPLAPTVTSAGYGKVSRIVPSQPSRAAYQPFVMRSKPRLRSLDQLRQRRSSAVCQTGAACVALAAASGVHVTPRHPERCSRWPFRKQCCLRCRHTRRRG